MEELQHIIDLIAEHFLPSISKSLVEKTFKYSVAQNPEIKDDLLNIKNSRDIENVIQKIKVVFEARAGDGSIIIYKTVIRALGGATFDHEKGIIKIGGSRIRARVLVIGGSAGSTGETTIGENSEVGSERATMKTGRRASVKMTGGASIRFS